MKVDTIQQSFAAGELSQLIGIRTDTKYYPIGLKQCRNFIPLIQGPAERRPATRYVAPTKNSGRVWFAKFVFDYRQAYVLEFGDNYIRFYANRGQVMDGGVPYEIASPWSISELTDADGTFKLRMVQSGDVIYIAHPDFQTRLLNRFGTTNWTLTLFETRGGPFGPTNSTATTVYIDETWTGPGMSGTVTLQASGDIFQAGHVGSLFFLQQQDFSAVAPWEPAKNIAVNDLRRNDFKTYRALNAKWTGTKQPLHEEGSQLDGANQIPHPDGNGTMVDCGVNWAYSDPGFVVLKITSVTDANTAEATIEEPIPGGQKGVPAYVCGSGNASDRWAFGKFNEVEGWPSNVTFFRDRLCLAKRQSLEFSVPQDFTDFSPKGLDNQQRADSAISITISSDRNDEIRWLYPADILQIGTTGGELTCSENSVTEAFGPTNRKISPQTGVGSSGVAPERVGSATLFVERSKRECRNFGFSYDSEGYAAKSEQKAWEHITKPGLSDMAYAQAPHSILWMARDDGVLVGQTKHQDEDTIAWHRHPIGGNDDDAGETPAFVECVESIPSPDGAFDDLWMVVRRRIDGQTVRYVEYLSIHPDMPNDLLPPVGADQATLDIYKANNDARKRLAFSQRLYADSGLTYDAPLAITAATQANPVVITSAGHALPNGTLVKIDGVVGMAQLNGKVYEVEGATTDTFSLKGLDGTEFGLYVSGGEARRGVTTLSGLEHLEGQRVQIAIDGAAHPDRVVEGGAIALQVPGFVVQVGLGYKSLIETLNLDVQRPTGTSQGKIKRVARVMFRFLETLGGRAGPSEYEADPIKYRAGGQPMGLGPMPVSGDWPEDGLTLPGGYNRHGRVVVYQDQPLPMTLAAVLGEAEA